VWPVISYATNDDLPFAVQRRLPWYAQDIFHEAVNRAFIQHDGDEAIAFHVAWAAVKRR